ncbi:type II secretion system minor pseudopilin GspI [Candidatus Sororendozoicomonas aggregata]|uniref:type II secretion system minor pseudopilin GspI n=1 Tax=Candidatus Sororendozoicomonas aggregata TaxID=3073239 RepID=UPI002ECFC0F2
MLKSFTNEEGFTLIEVMVALAIFAAAASMLMLSDGNNIKHTRYMQEKVFASQIADQELNALYALQLYPDTGTRSDIRGYAGYDWFVKETVRNGKIDGLRVITVDVYPGNVRPGNNDAPLYSLIGYLRRVKKNEAH